MKQILFFIALCSSINVAYSAHLKINEPKIDDFVGQWSYVSDEDVFILNLEKINDNEVVGSYNSVQYNGTRIDAGVDQEKNITGFFKADTLYLKFTGFYDENAHGEAKLYKENDSSIVWALGKCKGEFYLPTEAALKRPSSNPGGSAISCLGLKIVESETEEEGDYKLIEKFESYYQQAPFYQIPNGQAEDEDDDGGEIESMEISLDMCNFFKIEATNMWLEKIRTNNAIKICLLTTKKAQDNYITLLYTLDNSNKIIDKLLIGGNLAEEGVVKEYYIDDKNAIYTDKTDGQRVFDKKKYCINSAGKFEEVEE